MAFIILFLELLRNSYSLKRIFCIIFVEKLKWKI
nr:MAG TPA: hypothetical protein [Caudoviricetes sp.]